MKAHFAYFRYVLRHKWFVFVAGLALRVPLWQLIIHDWSKFTPAEWGAYVATFYGPDGVKRYQPGPAFDAAWNHHQKVNPHHWQYWVLIRDSDEPRVMALPMSERYAREMVADWCGAGRAITGRWEVRQWWHGTEGRPGNRERAVLHADTLALVDQLVAQAGIALNEKHL